MAKFYSLTTKEIDVLLSLHYRTIEENKKKIVELESENELTLYRISELTGELTSSSPTSIQNLLGLNAEDYNSDWPLWKKTQYILIELNKISNTRAIAEYIVKRPEEHYSNEDIKDIVSNLGSTLKQKVDRKEIFDRILIGSEYYYGLLNWFDKDGSPLKNYNSLLKNEILKEDKVTEYESKALRYLGND